MATASLFAQLAHRALDLGAPFEEHPARVFARAALERALGLAQREIARLDSLEARGGPRRVELHRLLASRKLPFPFLEVPQQRAHISLAIRKPRLRALQHILRKLQPARDTQAVRAAGNALDEPIRRREGDGIELQRPVDDAGVFRREQLESAEMRRRDREDAARRERIEDRAA